MQNIDQVFLYMKDEIERQAKSEEQAILNEVKALEDEAYESMKAEAKRDADLKLKQEEEEMSSNASAEISESHIERTKKLIEKTVIYNTNIHSSTFHCAGRLWLQLARYTSLFELRSLKCFRMYIVIFIMNFNIFFKKGPSQIEKKLLKMNYFIICIYGIFICHSCNITNYSRIEFFLVFYIKYYFIFSILPIIHYFSCFYCCACFII